MNKTLRAILSVLAVFSLVSCASMNKSSDDPLENFQKIREGVKKAMAEDLVTSGPAVHKGLDEAVKILKQEKESSSGRMGKYLKASINQLELFAKRTDFMTATKSQRIQSELALAEDRLRADLKKKSQLQETQI